MKIIVCTANNKGILFNKRRVSKDEEVIVDIFRNATVIRVSEYSRKLFDEYIGKVRELLNSCDIRYADGRYHIVEDKSNSVIDDKKKVTSQDEYYFVEEEIKDFSKVDEIIIYRWNRDYPADAFFKFNEKKFELQESKDFAGKSHERITRDIWKRKN